MSSTSGVIYPPPYPAVLPIFNPENYLYKDQVLTLALGDARYVKKGFLASGGGWGDYLYWSGTKWVAGSTQIRVGRNAGQTNQQSRAVAIGEVAGQFGQKLNAVAIGYNSGQTNQGESSVAIGATAGNENQGDFAFAMGLFSGQRNQGGSAIAVGNDSGRYFQGAGAIALGGGAGLTSQGQNAVAIGIDSGATYQGQSAVAIGQNSGENTQGSGAIAIGSFAGNNNQASNSVAIGSSAGNLNQKVNAIALGNLAGWNNQGSKAIALGLNSGYLNQGTSSISIGDSAGNILLGENGISIGRLSGNIKQIYSSVNDTAMTGIGSTGEQKYLGGVLAPNGKIFCVPYGQTLANNIRSILVIDTTTNTTSFLAIGGGTIPATGYTFTGAVLAPNGKIYLIPFNATIIPIIDPVAMTVDSTTMTGLPAGSKYWGGVLAPNGKIYGIPYDSNNVLLIDPTTNTYSTFGNLPRDGGGNTIFQKFRGGVLAPNGKIYCAPYNDQYQFIAQIDTTTNTLSYLSFPTPIYGAYACGVAIGTKLYITPSYASNVLIIESSNNTYDTTSISGITPLKTNWAPPALGEDGKIYCSDIQATNIFVIDPNTNTQTSSFSYTDSSGGSGANIAGAIAYKSGNTCRIYFPPYNGTRVIFIFGTLVGSNMISIGTSAGEVNQGDSAIAIGFNAGQSNQGINSVAIGINAGRGGQLAESIAIGVAAGNTNQGSNCIAIGRDAGQNGQGNNAIAIGQSAASTNQHPRSIFINASGTVFNTDGTDRCFIHPIRELSNQSSFVGNCLFRNLSSFEVAGIRVNVSYRSYTNTIAPQADVQFAGIAHGTTFLTIPIMFGCVSDQQAGANAQNILVSFYQVSTTGFTLILKNVSTTATVSPASQAYRISIYAICMS